MASDDYLLLLRLHWNFFYQGTFLQVLRHHFSFPLILLLLRNSKDKFINGELPQTKNKWIDYCIPKLLFVNGATEILAEATVAESGVFAAIVTILKSNLDTIDCR